MKNWQFGIIGILNGSYFAYYGYEHNHDLSMGVGLLLTALGLIAIIEVTTQKSIFQGIFSAVNAHRKSLVAVYEIYKRAPELLENQKKLEAIGQKMLKIDGRVEMWRRLAESEAQHGELMGQAEILENITVAAKPVASSKIKFIAHNEAGAAELGRIVQKSTELQVAAQGRALLVTDVGLSDVHVKNINDYLDGDIELDYWISKKIINGRDLLVLPNEVFVHQSRLVIDLCQKLVDNYDEICVLSQPTTIAEMRAAMMPANQQIISGSQPLYYSADRLHR